MQHNIYTLHQKVIKMIFFIKCFFVRYLTYISYVLWIYSFKDTPKTLYLHLLFFLYWIYSELVYIYSNSVRVSLVGEETNSVWNLVSLWVHGWVPPDWYKYPEYCAQPKHPHKADIQHYIEKGRKLHNVTKCCEPSLATQDALLGHCFIGSLDTRMWRREGSEESSNHSQGSDWSVGQRGQFRYRSKNLLVLNRILLIKKGDLC